MIDLMISHASGPDAQTLLNNFRSL